VVVLDREVLDRFVGHKRMMDIPFLRAYKWLVAGSSARCGVFAPDHGKKGGNVKNRQSFIAASIATASALSLVFLAVGSGGTVASASQPAPAATGARGQISQEATLAYWTAARLKSAKPVDVIAAGSAQSLQATHGATGKPIEVPGGAPLGASTAPGGSVHPASAPFDTFAVSNADTKLFPYDLNGKVFFTNDGGNFVCSATSVASHDASKAENEIWTAGHCAVNTESNDHNLDTFAEFIPAFNGAKCCKAGTVKQEEKWAPFGIFTWDGAWETATAWLNNRDLTEDEAAMEVHNSDITGDTLGQAVGWDGFAANEPVSEQFVTFGYPAGSPYNGNSMQADISATGGQDSNGGANGQNPIFIGSPFTGGSSGGAWNIDWSDSGPGFINGHNDYVYTNGSGQESPADQMYSPYQDTLSNTVRCFGKSSC
jgi:V8-like Glu-specific endopeptidase